MPALRNLGERLRARPASGPLIASFRVSGLGRGNLELGLADTLGQTVQERSTILQLAGVAWVRIDGGGRLEILSLKGGQGLALRSTGIESLRRMTQSASGFVLAALS